MPVRSAVLKAAKLVCAFAFLAYVAGPADAKQGPPAGSPPAGSPPPAAGTVPFQGKRTLTPQEQLAESAKHIGRMEQAGAGVRKMLSDARKDRDVVKTLCLNDKLSQIDVAIRASRDRRQALQAATNRNDADDASHQFNILTVHRQRVDQIVAEANQCIGEEAAFVGDTRTSVIIDPSIPPDETPYPLLDPGLFIPPPCTSCTQ